MIGIVLSGLVAFKFLPVSALPDVTYPTIQVQTFYPGASPQVMANTVTAPLERELGEMAGLNQMYSQSSAGASVITLQFDLSLSLDVAEQEVQAAINAAGNLLPSDLPAPPVYAKVNPADAPIMTLAVTSKTLKPHRSRKSREFAPGLENLRSSGGRPGQHRRRPCAGDPRRAEPARARQLRDQHRQYPHADHQPYRRHARRAVSPARRKATPSTPTTRSRRPRNMPR